MEKRIDFLINFSLSSTSHMSRHFLICTREKNKNERNTKFRRFPCLTNENGIEHTECIGMECGTNLDPSLSPHGIYIDQKQ
jgi:hypothetical protein